MSKLIGEALIEQGLISREQLENALKSQLFFGGHLGTNMIELGYVSEDDLGETLADVLKVRYASVDRLFEIPNKVLQALPVKLVEKHHIIPIELEERTTLHLAVINPRNLTSLSVATGYKIVPWVASESRIYQAMEKYYGIPQRPRYIRICQELDRDLPERNVTDRISPKPAVLSEPSEIPEVAAEPSSEASQGTNDGEMGAEYGYGRCWREILDDVIAGGDGPVEPPPERPTRPDSAPGQTAEVRTLEEASGLLSRVSSKDELARIVLDYASQRMQRCILFRVKAETAHVWAAHGTTEKIETLGQIGFPVAAGSIFTLLFGASHFRGPLEDPDRFLWFYRALQCDPPAEIVLLPIYLNDRLVAILYGDGGTEGKIEGETESLRKLAHKISLALNMIILRMRICAA